MTTGAPSPQSNTRPPVNHDTASATIRVTHDGSFTRITQGDTDIILTGARAKQFRETREIAGRTEDGDIGFLRGFVLAASFSSSTQPREGGNGKT